MSFEYILTSMIVILLPGTGVIYTLTWGLGQGMRASMFAALGCTFGIVPHIAASIAGLAAVLHTSAVAFQVVKYLGAAYLFYMAWSVLREKGTLDIQERKSGTPAPKIILNGIVLNILNPKLSLFFLAFLPQFIPAGEAAPTLIMLELAGIFMALTFIAFAGYGAFASLVRKAVISKPGILVWLRRSFAGAFALLGLKLALAER